MANAAFLDLYWTNGTAVLTDDDMAKYINDLSLFHITNSFLDLGKLDNQGLLKYDYPQGQEELKAFNESVIKRWISLTRRTDRYQKVIGTLNFGLWRNDRRPLGFNLQVFQNNLNNEIYRLLGLGLDGIHLDIEGFNKNDQDLLNMLTYLRDNSLYGVDYVSLSATHEPLRWDKAYIRQLASHVSELNPMLYDLYYGGITSQDLYVNLVRETVLRYSSAIKGTGCKLVPFLPAYRGSDDHRTDIETMEAGIKGVNLAIKQGASVDGVAIFWFPHFAGYYPQDYSKQLYQRDQVAFMRDWVRR